MPCLESRSEGWRGIRSLLSPCNPSVSPCFGNGLRSCKRNTRPDLVADAIGIVSDMPGEIISLLFTCSWLQFVRHVSTRKVTLKL